MSSIREILEKAFDEHYESEWIDTISEQDLRDMVRKTWAIRCANKDEDGQPYGFELKYVDISNEFDRAAYSESERYIAANPPLEAEALAMRYSGSRS